MLVGSVPPLATTFRSRRVPPGRTAKSETWLEPAFTTSSVCWSGESVTEPWEKPPVPVPVPSVL